MHGSSDFGVMHGSLIVGAIAHMLLVSWTLVVGAMYGHWSQSSVVGAIAQLLLSRFTGWCHGPVVGALANSL
jgi:hypothetical protein